MQKHNVGALETVEVWEEGREEVRGRIEGEKKEGREAERKQGGREREKGTAQ